MKDSSNKHVDIVTRLASMSMAQAETAVFSRMQTECLKKGLKESPGSRGLGGLFTVASFLWFENADGRQRHHGVGGGSSDGGSGHRGGADFSGCGSSGGGSGHRGGLTLAVVSWCCSQFTEKGATKDATVIYAVATFIKEVENTHQFINKRNIAKRPSETDCAEPDYKNLGSKF